MKRFVFLTVLFPVLFGAIVSTALPTEVHKTARESRGAPVAVAPVVALLGGANVQVQLDFENTWQQPIRYLEGPYAPAHQRGVFFLAFSLYKEGRFVEPRVPTVEPPILDERDVRELAPRDRVAHLLNLSKLYGQLGAGRYEMVARYRLPAGSYYATQYGITPILLEENVLHLEINEGEVPETSLRLSKTSGNNIAAGQSDPHVAVAPVLHVKGASRIEIQVDFENTSQRTIRYLLGYHGLGENGGLADLHFLLHRDGRFVAPLETVEPPELTKDRIRALKPGERLPHVLKLWNVYGDLQAGSYELIARYHVPRGSVSDTEFGITPLSFERKVLYLEIE